MSENKRIAKNTAFLYIRQIIVMLVAIYTSRVILDVLGASDYGIYNVVGGVVSMMSFLNSALGASSSRFLTYELGRRDQDKLNRTFSASLNLHISVALIVFIVGETLGLWFFYEKLVIPNDRIVAAFWVYQFSIITTMISFTQVPYNASLISHENMSIYAYVGLYEAISKLSIVYLLTISPIDKLIFYGLLLMLNSVGIQLFYRFYTTKRYEECRFRIVKEKSLYKTLLGYSGWDLFGNVAIICQGQGINILLNIFFGPVVNAARAIAFQIQNAVSMFVGSFLTAVRPQVVKSHAEGNDEAMYSLTFSGMKYAFLLITALAVPVILEIHYILNLWLGKAAPKETAIFTSLVLVNAIFQTWHNGFLMAFHAIGRIKTGNITGGVLMILSLPISYLFLKLGFDAYIVFIVIIVINLLAHINGMFLVHCYVRYSVKRAIRTIYIPNILVVICSIIPTILVRDLMESSFLRLITVGIIYEILLIISTWIFVLGKEEKKIVTQYLSKYVDKNFRK